MFWKCVQEMITERRVGSLIRNHKSECAAFASCQWNVVSPFPKGLMKLLDILRIILQDKKENIYSMISFSAVVTLSDHCPFKSHLMRLWFTSVVENLLLNQQLKTFCAHYKIHFFLKKNEIFICFYKSEKKLPWCASIFVHNT